MRINNLMLNVQAIDELKLVFRHNGWNKVLKEQAEIKTIEHLIDCDSAPFIPKGWSLEEHRRNGFLKFDPAKISLYLPRKQKKGIEGEELRKILANKPVMNANILDYLLDHPELIPEDWKDKYVFFWGTIYRLPNGVPAVRCLEWDYYKQSWGYVWWWLNRYLRFNYLCPAATFSQ
ncbi:MAG TPA: hypothetical protein PLI25_03055 [bacterium]|jgi:hypothetical protein|nr:hypothetical protein [bacterium]